MRLRSSPEVGDSGAELLWEATKGGGREYERRSSVANVRRRRGLVVLMNSSESGVLKRC